MRGLLISVLLAALMGCGSGGGGQVKSDVRIQLPDRTETSRSLTSPRDATFGKLLNSYRLASGVGNVKFDSRLNAAAQKHAQNMVDQNFFSHTGKDGRTVGDRVRSEGYDFRFVGEALAARQRTEAQIMKDWKNSPSHDAVLTDSRAEDFGLGVAGSGSTTKWALVVGAEKQ